MAWLYLPDFKPFHPLVAVKDSPRPPPVEAVFFVQVINGFGTAFGWRAPAVQNAVPLGGGASGAGEYYPFINSLWV